MLEVKRLLKQMNSEIIYKVIRIAGLNPNEAVIIRDFFIRKRHREDICRDLNISLSNFAIIKNQALLKIKIHLTLLLDEKIKQMG
jgi:DNA-directed RNA polymerase specialized sigma subunit